jgi:hypothetical protein
MRRSLSTLTAALALGACVPYYPPARGEPHALVKVRVAYHAQYQGDLQHAVYVNGQAVAVPLPPASVQTPYTTALRVRPGPVRWKFVSAFQHKSTRTVQLTQMGGPISCQLPAGSPGGDNPLHGPLPGACTPYLPYPAPPTTEFVTDASCEAKAEHAVRPNEIYLVQYDFYGDGQCRARCYIQVEAADGQFRLTPCSR